MVELTVILKDDERTYRQKFLVYENIYAIPEDENIITCIAEAKKNFVGEPDEITIKMHLEIR